MEPNSEINTELPSVNPLEAFFEKNWKTLSCVILALIIILGFVFFRKALKQSKLQEDGEGLVSASLSNDSPITKLDKISKDKEKTITGGNALLLLANKHLDDNPPNLEKAETVLKKFASDHKDSPLYYDGLFALATLHEEFGNNEDAITLYKKINSPENSASPASAIRLADLLYKEGKYNDASEAYVNAGITSSFASVFSKIARSKLSSTEEKIALTENPPPSFEPAPKAEEPAPKAEVPAPTAEVPAPKAEVPAPKAEVPAPKAEVPAPKAEEPAPKAEEPAPKAEEPAPKAEEPTPKVEEPVSE
jgi:predicted negative regulator of RcsB-dependent stress response